MPVRDISSSLNVLGWSVTSRKIRAVHLSPRISSVVWIHPGFFSIADFMTLIIQKRPIHCIVTSYTMYS